MTNATGAWLEQDATQALFAAFRGAGYELYCVGGCVRDALLGVPVSDIDMSTDATPEQILALAKALKLRAVPTGIEHGTVTLLKNDIPFEITTYRKDVETDGRRAVVAFAKTLEEDAQRRDLTMNALYCDARGAITDPVGGIPDIAAQRVRFIGVAEERIKEDYLRILRFFRFYAWYGAPEGGIDADGLAACAELADGIETLSAERIGAEMRKLLSAPDPSPAIAAMAQSGVLHRVMPGAEPGLLAVYVHFEAGRKPNWLGRVLALGGGDVTNFWRLTKAEARSSMQMRSALEKDVSVAEIAYRHGPENAWSVALVRSAAMQTTPDPQLGSEIENAAQATFPVGSADLMPKLQGAALGTELKRLEASWIASNFTLNKADLLGE
ncbi:MAG: CCA tRNA nucleotidyltransferase [Pseudomonadota bacterium]